MNWELFYLICFVVGFAFTTLSFLSGTLHLHLPGHGHFHVGHAGHHGGAQGSHGSSFGFFNPMTIAVFMAWFGGTGYLLVHLRHIFVLAGLALSTIAGLAGAGIVVTVATKYFLANESSLDPMDFDMIGVLGTVAVPSAVGAPVKSFSNRKARANHALPAARTMKRCSAVKKLW
jgi:hypothetical protein